MVLKVKKVVKKETTKKEHPWFKAVQKDIEKQGYTKEQAGAILAKKTREANPKAKAKNPALNKVKMPKKK